MNYSYTYGRQLNWLSQGYAKPIPFSVVIQQLVCGLPQRVVPYSRSMPYKLYMGSCEDFDNFLYTLGSTD